MERHKKSEILNTEINKKSKSLKVESLVRIKY